MRNVDFHSWIVMNRLVRRRFPAGYYVPSPVLAKPTITANITSECRAQPDRLPSFLFLSPKANKIALPKATDMVALGGGGGARAKWARGPRSGSGSGSIWNRLCAVS